MGYFEKLWAKLSGLTKEKAGEIRTALGLEQLADGRAVNIDDATGAVTLCNADGTPGEALPDGEYDLANGGKLVVAGGLRTTGENPADVEATEQPKDGAAEAAPAPLPETAGLPDVVKAVNDLIAAVGKEKLAADPATAPAGQKLGAALHGVKLEAIGEKLGALKLDAIDLVDGDKLTYNSITRRLTDSKGALVESGYYAAADGSYFSVDTDQYIWEISKQSYDAIYKLAAVELELAQVRATTPAGRVVKLHGEGAAPAAPTGTATQKLGLSAVAHLRAMQEAAEA